MQRLRLHNFTFLISYGNVYRHCVPYVKKKTFRVDNKTDLLMRELVTLNPVTLYRYANNTYGFCFINVPLESIVSEYRRYLY